MAFSRFCFVRLSHGRPDVAEARALFHRVGAGVTEAQDTLALALEQKGRRFHPAMAQRKGGHGHGRVVERCRNAGREVRQGVFLELRRLSTIAEVGPGLPVEIGFYQVGSDRWQGVDRLLAVVGRGDDQTGHMVEMGMADQVTLDLRGEHVARPALVGVGRHRDARERPLLLGDTQPVHQRAGVAGDGTVVAMRMDEGGAEVAVLDAAQGAQHHQIESVGGNRRVGGGEECHSGEDDNGKSCGSHLRLPAATRDVGRLT